MQKPSKAAEDKMMLLHRDRMKDLYNALVLENSQIRIHASCGQDDIYRNASTAIFFWLRGNIGNRAVILDEPGNHMTPFEKLYHRQNGESRIKGIIKQVEHEAYMLHEYEPENFVT